MQIEAIMDMQLPLMFFGDFSYILNEMDKKGGRPFQVNRNIQDFRDLVHRTCLIDLEYHGPKFTSYNNRYNRARVWERVDRAFGFDL